MGQLNYPTAAAVSADELTIWVADFDNDRVAVWARPNVSSTDWSNQTTFGSQGNGSNQFQEPNGVAASATGWRVWVANSDQNRISIWGVPCPE